MRQLTITFTLATLLLSSISPALGAKKQGLPGRRVGGGTRWSVPQIKQPLSKRGEFNAVALAPINNLPTELKIEAIYS